MSLNTDTIAITPEMLSLISEIDEFKGAWRALGTLAPDRLSALRHVATIESIGSSTRIEGSRLSDREVEQLLSNLEIRKFDTRDEQEVAGYAAVMEMVFSSAADIPPRLPLICQPPLHFGNEARRGVRRMNNVELMLCARKSYVKKSSSFD